LDRALHAIRAQHPGYTMSATSLAVIGARNSADMIERFSRGITIEVLFIAAFIGLAFRSFIVMLASLLPAVFPVVAAGSLLWVLGDGMRFASVVALEGVPRAWAERDHPFPQPAAPRGQGGGPSRRGGGARDHSHGTASYPDLDVLACGLVVTVFSNLPVLRLFGWLSAVAMLLAVIADLTILRRTITLLRIWATRAEE
jgi:uncharacterized protein